MAAGADSVETATRSGMGGHSRVRRMAPRVWVARDEDAEAVSELIAAFRDWWGKDRPPLDQIRETVGVLLPDTATDFLLAAPGDEEPPAGVCQLRYRLSVWTGADDCWLEDLYVPDGARWLPALEAEMAEFPRGKHDDQVDVMTYAALEQAGWDDATVVG